MRPSAGDDSELWLSRPMPSNCLVTNPVDVITYVTLKLSGLPGKSVSWAPADRARILRGLRFLIALASRVRLNVHAYIAARTWRQ